MLSAFQQQLQQDFPQLQHAKILLAISGGVDSVVLAHLCKKSHLDIGLAHCNFHLRKEESDADEAFAVELAKKMELQVFVEHFDTQKYAEQNKVSIQMAARDLRYAWFEEIRHTFGFEYVLTAHHANDSLETFLINLVRGTGLDGLTGIPEKHEKVVRPLLGFSRNDILEYAKTENISWREDHTNASTKYLRNKLRLELIPMLEEINPQFLEGFQKTQSHLRQSSQLVENYISVLFSRLAQKTDFGYAFNIKMLKSLDHTQAVLFELFRGFGFREWNDVVSLLDAQSGKMVVSKTHRLIKDRDSVLLTQFPEENPKVYFITAEDDLLMLAQGNFQLKNVKEMVEIDENSIFVDKAKLQFPLQLRKRKKGDVFQPFGMKGSKKLSKYFKDNKVSLPEKENCWLLCSGQQIVWVVGHRADARFSVEPETTEILKISFIS